MPINMNNPVGPVDSLAALKALMRGNTGVNPPSLNASDPLGYVQGAANRDARLGEMKHNLANAGPNFSTGANRADVAGLEEDIAGDPFTGQAAHQNVAEEEALNQKMQQYGRPDVTEARQNTENFALKKLLMPLQMKGQYDVEAAKQRAESQAARDTSLMGGRETIANINQTGQNERADAGIEAAIRKQRLQALQTKKAHAARPGGMMDSLFGPSQQSLDDAEIAQLMGGQSQANDAAPTQASSAPQPPPAPAGWKYVPKPGGGWTAIPE